MRGAGKQMPNHPLEADYHHTLERLGLDPDGSHRAAAREHAREAGREALSDGVTLGDIPGHIAPWPDLRQEYEKGFAEAEAEGIASVMQKGARPRRQPISI